MKIIDFKKEETGLYGPIAQREHGQDLMDKLKTNKVSTSDCPVYQEAQGKKYNPYVVTKKLCLRCPFFNKQCDGKRWVKHGK